MLLKMMKVPRPMKLNRVSDASHRERSRFDHHLR